MQPQYMALFEAPQTQNMRSQAAAVFELLDVSLNTRKDYQARIGLFLVFVRRNGLDRNSFLSFKRELADRTDISISTKNKYLVTARIFLKELNRQGVLPADITQNIKSFSDSRKHKKDGLSEAEVALLSEKLRELPITLNNTRLKAIVSLLALQGLRQIEIVRLNIQDVQLARRVAFIQGKGRDGKESINLHPESVRILKEYIVVNRVADGPLFTSNSNNSLHQRLSTRSLRNIVQTSLLELGIEKSTHAFRHYFTTKLIKAYKGDLLQVAQYTRHKNDEDLPRYYQTFEGVRF